MKRISKSVCVCQTFDEAVKAILVGSRIYVPVNGELLDMTNYRVRDIKWRFDKAKLAVALFNLDTEEEVEE